MKDKLISMKHDDDIDLWLAVVERAKKEGPWRWAERILSGRAVQTYRETYVSEFGGCWYRVGDGSQPRYMSTVATLLSDERDRVDNRALGWAREGKDWRAMDGA